MCLGRWENKTRVNYKDTFIAAWCAEIKTRLNYVGFGDIVLLRVLGFGFSVLYVLSSVVATRHG